MGSLDAAEIRTDPPWVRIGHVQSALNAVPHEPVRNLV